MLEPEFHEMTSGKNSDKLDSIDRRCILHPGKFRFLGGPGFRIESTLNAMNVCSFLYQREMRSCLERRIGDETNLITDYS